MDRFKNSQDDRTTVEGCAMVVRNTVVRPMSVDWENSVIERGIAVHDAGQTTPRDLATRVRRATRGRDR